MLGKPKYERDDKVCFELDGTVKQGYVYIVDAYGTFFQADEALHIKTQRHLELHAECNREEEISA